MSIKGSEILSTFVHRLAAVFAEMDRELYGEGTEAPMGDEAKVYRCRECQETFPSSQALAGHVNHHRHVARPPSRRRRSSRRRRRRRGTYGTQRPEKRPIGRPGSGPPRPRTAGACPAPRARSRSPPWVVAEDFTLEGVDEALAAKLAAKAYGLLRVPA